MPADSLLHDRLKSYIFRQSTTDSGLTLERPGLPAALVPPAQAFALFEWLTFADASGAQRAFGIRRLVDQTPFRLSDLRAEGFRTESLRHPVRPPIKGSVEHYLIAELVTADSARVFLCMCTPSKEWYVLDEHRISRAAAP